MFRPASRMPAAMLAWPAIRKAPIARLRRVAITRGALPARICERSSSNITSLTQWIRFSIPQCPRMRSASSFGPVRSGARLVMWNEVSIDDGSWLSHRTSIRNYDPRISQQGRNTRQAPCHLFDGVCPSAASRSSIELGQHLTDDLRRLVSGERVAAFRLCDLSSKVFD